MKLRFLSLFLLVNAANALQILQGVDENTVVKQQDNITLITQEQSSKQLLVNLKKSAKSGDARAQYSLANMYHNGTNVPQDNKLAFYWYLQVAKQGYANAQLDVANYYYDGVGTNKNIKQAANWYKTAAQQGNLDARYYWALMLLTGETGDKDIETALSILLSLSMKEHTLAQYLLSQIYRQGEISEQDDELSEAYLYQASKGGHVLSQYQLGKIYYQKQLLTDAIHWLSLSAEQNHQGAKVLLSEVQAKMHAQEQAINPIPKPESVADFIDTNVTIHTQPKAQITPKAEVKTKPQIQDKPKIAAVIPLSTSTVRVISHKILPVNAAPVTEMVTIKTTPIALTLDPVPSQFQIARSLLENARSMPDVEALVLRTKQSDPVAQYKLGVLFGRGEVVPKDNNKAFKLMQISAEQGLSRAQNTLAMMYINGIGVEPNAQLANFWARASARQGDPKGMQILLYLLGIF